LVRSWLLQVVPGSDGAAKSQSQAGPRRDAATATSASTTTTAAFFLTAFTTSAALHCARPRGTFLRNLHVSRNRLEIEHGANEGAQRHDELRRVHGPSRGELGRGARGEANLVFRAQQDDVGERGLDRITDAARAVGARRVGVRRSGLTFEHAGAAQVAQMRGIDGQIAGERATQRLVRRDQGAQALVDLAILALPPLLDRLHEHEPDADAE
jgi:hypothetical protein